MEFASTPANLEMVFLDEGEKDKLLAIVSAGGLDECSLVRDLLRVPETGFRNKLILGALWNVTPSSLGNDESSGLVVEGSRLRSCAAHASGQHKQNDSFVCNISLACLLMRHFTSRDEDSKDGLLQSIVEILTSHILSPNECVIVASAMMSDTREFFLRREEVAIGLMLMRGIHGLGAGYWSLVPDLWEKWRNSTMHSLIYGQGCVVSHKGTHPEPFSIVKSRLMSTLSQCGKCPFPLPISRLICSFLSL